MATLTRQPFAPLNGVRLQNLTSLKNRQNALTNTGPSKRKASELLDVDDFENVDPALFAKRSKGSEGCQGLFKPSNFLLTKASAPSVPKKDDSFFSNTNPLKPSGSAASSLTSPRPRAFLEPKSPAAKLKTSLAKSSTPQSAPAGRSPTRGSKRIGLLSSRRRASGPSGRIDPPSCSLSPAIPFSLDAALKGTIPSYAPHSSLLASLSSAAPATDLHEPELKSSWFFDIHEDTPEQEMTNLLQHSTCVLDISSDEESEVKVQRERAEGRDKENVPPLDDVSQTTRASGFRGSAAVSANLDDMLVEKVRDPLSEMNAADFYSAGCDGSEIVIVPGDDGEEEPITEGLAAPAPATAPAPAPAPVEAQTFDFVAELNPVAEIRADVDELMTRTDEPAAKAALLEPIEGTGESFDLWESGSAKDEMEAPASPAQVAETVAA